MRACLWLLLLASCTAQQLISYDEIERLVGEYMHGTLPEEDVGRFQELAEILALPGNFVRSGIDGYSSPRLTLTCLLCRSVFRTLIDDVNNGRTDEEVDLMITNLCTGLSIESHRVCAGVVTLNVPIITYIIRQNPGVSPNTFCGLAFQSIDQETCPFDDERFEFEVTLPPPSGVTLPPIQGEPLTIALLSDAHIDPLYKPFGSGDCGEPTCCRVGQSDAAPALDEDIDASFLAEAIHRDGKEVSVDLEMAEMMRRARQQPRMVRTSEPAGYWGDYRACDTPIWAFDDVLDQVSGNHQVDIVYYLGDTIDHGVWETTYPLINNMNQYLVTRLQQAFGDVPIFPVIGNHESQPTNQFAPSSVTRDDLQTQWLYDNLTEQWGHWLPEEAKETVKAGGYYTALVRPGLRVIGVNTNIAYKYNWWVVHDPQDARSHLQWLADTLYEAERAGERVHILSHIPPGVHDLTKVWTREYNRIISRFTSIIMAEFNGHTHRDEFKLFYSDTDGTPINVAWNAGAMTSYTYYNVNYKIVTINSEYVPVDMETYMYNLTEANMTPQQSPNWYRLYDFRDTYGVTDLSAAQVDQLVHRMVTDEKDLLDTYTVFYHKLSPYRMVCDEECKINRLCATVVTELWERNKCEELRTLYYADSN